MIEALGSIIIWAPIPLAWFWIGGQVYGVTSSLMATGAVVLGGLIGSSWLAFSLLLRIDRAWVRLRRRAGYEQKQGALNQVVVVTSTFALVSFWVWFHIIERAFIIPFLPTS